MEAAYMDKSQDLRDSSNTPASTLDQSTSPSTEASSTVPPAMRQSLSRRSSAQATKTTTSTRVSSHTPKDVQFYLNYFKEHITHHHYSLKRDSHNFLKGDFMFHVMRHEPLKYAVAGYAAYFHTISQPDGRMSTFLQFYNESVSRLRLSIAQQKKQGLATFLTILQLASIEVRTPWDFLPANANTSNRRCSVTGSISWDTRKLLLTCLLVCTHPRPSLSQTSS